MEALLEFFGPNFDVDSALAILPMREHATVWHKGESRGPKVCDSSGFSLWIGGDDDAGLERQISEAIGVLADDEVEIRRIRALPGVETARLRFGEFWPANIVAHSPRLPSELLLKCGHLGLDIVLCQYLSDEPDDATDAV